MSERMLKTVICAGLIYFAIVAVGRFTPKDNTDTPDSRSGLGLYTDNLTGCQYLSAGLFGGITPRLDKNGNHLCEVKP